MAWRKQTQTNADCILLLLQPSLIISRGWLRLNDACLLAGLGSPGPSLTNRIINTILERLNVCLWILVDSGHVKKDHIRRTKQHVPLRPFEWPRREEKMGNEVMIDGAPVNVSRVKYCAGPSTTTCLSPPFWLQCAQFIHCIGWDE